MRSVRTIQNPHDNTRRASVLVCVLVCLAIAMSLSVSMVRDALQERRAMRTQHQVRQVELLLAAGIQRAIGQLQAVADYRGETWELGAEVIYPAESAQVEIEVSSAAESDSGKIRVTARISRGRHQVIQRSYRFPTDLSLLE